ncbi:hypothetical protein BGZ79_000743 [Entomortierella chlamydospora]|nr:hypothetical protein BGZ79_000743 [Entomortierella chlamydospora]
MSNYSNRSNNDAGRAPFPANNRQIPNSIRANGTNTVFCYGCSQTKSRLAFSETQLKKASTRNPDKKHHIMCKQCTPAQPTSLRCVRCAKTQSMDNFSKTQRKNGNNATCRDCREYLDNDDSEEDLDIASDPEYYEGDMKDIL